MRGGLRMSTIDRNADNCEAGREKRCVCSCGGKLHGIRHSRAWRAKVFEDAQAAQAARGHVLDDQIAAGQIRYCSRCKSNIPRRNWGGRCAAAPPSR